MVECYELVLMYLLVPYYRIWIEDPDERETLWQQHVDDYLALHPEMDLANCDPTLLPMPKHICHTCPFPTNEWCSETTPFEAETL